MDGSQRFVDVRFSRYMLENEIGMICVPREKNWLREVSSGSMEGLWNTFTKKMAFRHHKRNTSNRRIFKT